MYLPHADLVHAFNVAAQAAFVVGVSVGFCSAFVAIYIAGQFLSIDRSPDSATGEGITRAGD